MPKVGDSKRGDIRSSEKMYHNKWQSIQALSQDNKSLFKPTFDSSFDRIKKSYATMRKSFRLKVSDRRVLNATSASSRNDYSSANGGKSKRLIGQLGSGAAKLLRGVYAKSQTNNHQLELESIHQSTNGSFKVLSSMGNYGSYVPPQLAVKTNGQNSPTAAVRKMKSEVELEIEQRLRRSKRRVLPSASYSAPDCEKACDDLNMEELEEIKRDNLRLTLRSQKISKLNEEVDYESGHKDERNDGCNDEVKVEENILIGCSCKNSYNDVHYHEQVERDTCPEQLYCSCASLSTFSSSTTSLSSVDQTELSVDRHRTATDRREATCYKNKPQKFTTTTTTDHNNELQPETPSCTQANIDNRKQEAQDVSRASSGFNVRDSSLIENKFEEMFDSIVEFRFLERLNRKQREQDEKQQQNKLVENCCGSGRDCVKSSPSSESLLIPELNSNTKSLYEERELYVKEQVKGKETADREWSSSKKEKQAAPNCSSSLGGVITAQIADARLESMPDVSLATLNLNCEHHNNSNESAGINKQVAAIEPKRATGEEKDGHGNCARESACEFVCSTNNPADENRIRVLADRLKLEEKQVKRKANSARQQQVSDNEYQVVENVVKYEEGENDLLMSKRQSSKRRREQLLQSLTEVADVCRAGQQHQKQQQRHQNSTMGFKINSPSMRTRRVHASSQVYSGEEHLYASISSQTPSPERNLTQQSDQIVVEKEFYNNPQCSRLQYECASNEPSLFDKQLNNCHYIQFPSPEAYQHITQQEQQRSHCKISKHESMTSVSKPRSQPKKSFLSKLKNFITPTNKFENKQQGTASFWSNTEFNPVNEKLMNQDEKNFRWQKSATLTSKSTQNLLGSSLRYLSTSRKSMNLIGIEDNSYSGDRDDTETNNSRKFSLVNGFLTLRRRTTMLDDFQLKKHELVHEIFKDKKLNQVIRNNFGGSTDSLPSADSGLSCSNLQNSTSSDDYGAVRAITQSNIYTRVPLELEHDNVDNNCYLSDEELRTNQVVGKAVAKVDCNPCAYDKEALVFKQGDIIDILERHQSGTWIGRCNGRVGHFKFINVLELDDELESTCSSVKSSKSSNNINTDTSTTSGPSVFVTKLEIRSKNNENNQMRNKAETSSSSSISRRSHSMNTINDDKTNCESATNTITATTTTTTSVTAPNSTKTIKSNTTSSVNSIASSKESSGNLSCSSQTIMSSLEQLLFAIGLSGEQVVNRKHLEEEEGVSEDKIKGDSNQERTLTDSDTCCFTQDDCNKKQQALLSNDSSSEGGDQQQNTATTTSLSYLDILCKGGINNLDSFSAIDDFHELEQIGIKDDEHQRRLLMAARIIRQASQAAKLDFAESYRTKSACSTSPTMLSKSLKPSSLLPPPPPPPPVSTKIESVDSKQVKTATRSKANLNCKTSYENQSMGNHFNEPIYVNMIRLKHNNSNNKIGDSLMTSFSDTISGESSVNQCRNGRKVQDLVGATHVYNLVDDLDAQQSSGKYLNLHPSGTSSKQYNDQHNKQQRYCIDYRLQETKSTARSSHASRVNLIKQFDNYHRFPLPGFQASGQNRETLPSAGGSHDDYNTSDKAGDLFYLARGSHLVRINGNGKDHNSSFQRVQQLKDGDFNWCGHQNVNSDKEAEANNNTNNSIYSMYNRRVGNTSSINNDDDEVVSLNQLQNLRRQQSNQSNDLNESGTLSKMFDSDWLSEQQTIQQESKLRKNHHINSKNTKGSNLRSQISSKSAYDLRLDLSHFFS